MASYGFNFVWPDINEVSPLIDFNPPVPPYPYTHETFLELAEQNDLMGLFGLSYREPEWLWDGTITWNDIAALIDKVKGSPALMGYKIIDEPENFYDKTWTQPTFLEEIGASFRATDPGRPTLMSNIDEKVFPRFARIADIYDINIYPIHTNPADGSPYDVAVNMDLARVAVGGKGPVWATLQAYGNVAIEERTGRWPTPAEIRNMTYLALAHGAQGIAYFRFVEERGPDTIQTEELAQAVCDLAGELRDLSPVLLSTQTVFDALVGDNPEVECFVKLHQQVSYLFAINNAATAQDCFFSFPGLSADVQVLFESRSVSPQASPTPSKDTGCTSTLCPASSFCLTPARASRLGWGSS